MSADARMHDGRTFWHGVLVGIAGAAIAVATWLAVALADTRRLYDDMGATMTRPAITRIVLSPLWRWAVPVAGAALLALVVRRRPRVAAPYALLALALVAATLVTWHFAQAPMYELADKIKE